MKRKITVDPILISNEDYPDEEEQKKKEKAMNVIRQGLRNKLLSRKTVTSEFEKTIAEKEY